MASQSRKQETQLSIPEQKQSAFRYSQMHYKHFRANTVNNSSKPFP